MDRRTVLEEGPSPKDLLGWDFLDHPVYCYYPPEPPVSGLGPSRSGPVNLSLRSAPPPKQEGQVDANEQEGSKPCKADRNHDPTTLALQTAFEETMSARLSRCYPRRPITPTCMAVRDPTTPLRARVLPTKKAISQVSNNRRAYTPMKMPIQAATKKTS
ncbi:hypothetical protein NMY22_g8278 [Coprinellus aureogranulatus]|nr:hypothetical protein NMY22_g8278 [Coprinellus aureogranulatus]